MIWKEKKDPIDQELQDYFAEVYKETTEKALEDLPDIQMASWEEIEKLADEIELSEAAEEPVFDTYNKKVRRYRGGKKRLAGAILAAAIGTLLLGGVANGDRIYRYVIEYQWRNGQSEMNVDSNKVQQDRSIFYAAAVDEILRETGVQSIQSMDLSWELTEYEIEGKYSYLTFKRGETEILVKQRSYSGSEITMLQVSDKEYAGEEQNSLIKELICPIYCEEVYDGGMSYESIFTLSEALYIVQSKCTEEEFRNFIKEIYIKRTIK